MKRFIFLAALFVAASLCSVAQTIAELTPAAAVNTSGKQRMLTQRMAKDFVLKGMGIQTEQVQKELNLSIIMFE
nr:type IV pili methyl-accepting chemotaxis transducer N-terminal domain-containing protein [Spirosomataceae bacterium]